MSMVNTGKILSGQRGVVLPTVLWITLVMVIMAAGYSSTVRLNSKSFLNMKQAMQLRYAATAGVHVALERLLNDPSNRSMVSGQKYFEMQLEGTRVSVSVMPEWKKLSLNQSTEAQLHVGLMSAGVSDAHAMLLAQRFLDWRDADHSRRAQGMEDTDYRDNGKHYGASDKAFLDLAELNMIPGMNRELFRAIEPALTIYTQRSGNIVTIKSTAGSSEKQSSIKAVVKLGYSAEKPYSVLKWYYNDGAA